METQTPKYTYKPPKDLYKNTKERIIKCLPFLPIGFITFPYGMGIILGLIWYDFLKDRERIKKYELDKPPLQRKAWIEANKDENLSTIFRSLKEEHPYIVFIPCKSGGVDCRIVSQREYVETYGGTINNNLPSKK